MYSIVLIFCYISKELALKMRKEGKVVTDNVGI